MFLCSESTVQGADIYSLIGCLPHDPDETNHQHYVSILSFFLSFLGEFLIYEVSNLTTQTRRIIRFALPAPDREFKLSG